MRAENPDKAYKTFTDAAAHGRRDRVPAARDARGEDERPAARRCTDERRERASAATTTPASCPRCSTAIAAANDGPRAVLRRRRLDARASRRCFRERVRRRTRSAFLVFNGTGANVVALRALCRPWEGVDLRRDRAPQRRRGRRARARWAALKLLTVADARRQAHARARRAAARALRRRARRPAAGRLDHAVDRARHALHARRDARRSPSWRTSTACSCTSTARGWPTPPPRSACSLARGRRRGVDALSFGGTKDGLLFGEAVVFLRPELADGAALPAQAVDAARVEDALRRRAVRGAARRRALARAPPAHANAMARAAGRRASRDVRASRSPSPSQANAVFAIARRRGAAERLRERLVLLHLGRGAPARCAGCARGTRRRRTSTPSRPTSGVSARLCDRSHTAARTPGAPCADS